MPLAQPQAGPNRPDVAGALAMLQRTTTWWKEYPHPWPSANPGSGPTNPSKEGRNRASATVSGVAAFEGSPFVLGQSAPDSGVLTGLNSPFQAGLNHLASTADGLCLLCLEKRGAVVPDRKEQLGSTPRQAARSRQVIRIVLLAPRSGVSITGVNSGGEPVGVTGPIKANISVNVKVTAKSGG
jgi:hypothetical protein